MKEYKKEDHITKYKAIEHVNSARRRHERNWKNPTTLSIQVVRDGPRPVDVKRQERADKKGETLKARY